MDYSKEYYEFYDCYNFVMGLACAGVIKDIESLKDGIMYAYNRIESRTEGNLMPDDVDGDGKMQCDTLQRAFDIDEPDDFRQWVKDYHMNQLKIHSIIEESCGDKLRELRLMKDETLGIEQSKDEYGVVNDNDRMKVYASVIMKALKSDGDNADFCIRLFKYAEKLEGEMPNNKSAKSISRLLDAVRDAMSKDDNIRETLKRIVDSDD